MEERAVKTLDVRIVRLEPMLVASAYGFGESPEGIAWEKLLDWARKAGLLDDVRKRRFFGFNNPSPSPGSPNYGYEQWMTAGEGAMPSGDIRLVYFSGGLYAVTRTRLAAIGQTWQNLSAWRENSSYKQATHQWLEECLTSPLEQVPFEAMEFDIYLPVAE